MINLRDVFKKRHNSLKEEMRGAVLEDIYHHQAGWTILTKKEIEKQLKTGKYYYGIRDQSVTLRAVLYKVK